MRDPSTLRLPGRPVPTTAEEKASLSAELNEIAERAAQELGAADVFILATFRDGEFAHAADGTHGEWDYTSLPDVLSHFARLHAQVERKI